jgi:excisionase family DNA binding protein
MTRTKENPPRQPGGLTPILVSRPDAAAMLGIRQRKLDELTRCGVIPHRRIGRRVLFRPADLHEWVENGCPTSC